MSPEMPYLAAGTVSIVGGIARERRFPSHGLNAIVGTVILVLVASMTAGSRIAPVVRAIGLLLFMAAVIAATPAFNTRKR